MFQPSPSSPTSYSFGQQTPHDGLRRRTGISDSYSSSTYADEMKNKTEMKSKIMKSIRSFDLYSKTDSVATKKTSLGGVGKLKKIFSQ